MPTAHDYTGVPGPSRARATNAANKDSSSDGSSAKQTKRVPLKQLNPNAQTFQQGAGSFRRLTRSSAKTSTGQNHNFKQSSASSKKRYSPYEPRKQNTRKKPDEAHLPPLNNFPQDQTIQESREESTTIERSGTNQSSNAATDPGPRRGRRSTASRQGALPEMQQECIRDAINIIIGQPQPKISQPVQQVSTSLPSNMRRMEVAQRHEPYPYYYPNQMYGTNPAHATLPVTGMDTGAQVLPPGLQMQGLVAPLPDNSMTTHACDLEDVSPMAAEPDAMTQNPGSKRHVFDINDRGSYPLVTQLAPPEHQKSTLEQMVLSPTPLAYRMSIFSPENINGSSATNFLHNNYARFSEADHELLVKARGSLSQYNRTDSRFYRHEKSYDDDWILSDDINEPALPTNRADSATQEITRFAFRQHQMKQAGSSLFKSRYCQEVSYASGTNNAIGTLVPMHEEYRADYYYTLGRQSEKQRILADYAEKMADQRDRYMEEAKHRGTHDWLQVYLDTPTATSLHRKKYKDHGHHSRKNRRVDIITARTRFRVVDWMLELLDDEKALSPESYHVAISLIDRYLSAKARRRYDQHGMIFSDEMQEVGVTAFSIASKYIDYLPPKVRWFADMTEYQAEKRDILERERDFLKEMSCELSSPTPFHFLQEMITSLNLTAKQFRPSRRAALYLCDLSRLDYKLLEFDNSIIAASCLFLGLAAFDFADLFRSRRHIPFCHLNMKKTSLLRCIDALYRQYEQGPLPSVTKEPYCVERWQVTVLTLRRSSLSIPSHFEQQLQKLSSRW